MFGKGSRVYRLRVAGCTFAVLDNCSRDASTEPWERQLARTHAWLSEHPDDLKFVFIHKPVSTVPIWAHHAMNDRMSVPFARLMTRHRTDHVFQGHIHAYSTARQGGVDYTVTGGGGAPLDPRYGRKGACFHYLVVDVEDGAWSMRAIRVLKREKVYAEDEDEGF
jgi:hypothetical protein